MLSAEQQAALKKQAEELLAGLLTLQDRLTDLNASSWANEDWQRYQELSDAGDNAFLANDFTAAVGRYTEATSLGRRDRRASRSSHRTIAERRRGGARGRQRRARDRAIRSRADDRAGARAALAQRARAERLPEVLALVQRADAERARGELEAALGSYREALASIPPGRRPPPASPK